MDKNVFKCPKCGKITMHIKIGMRESVSTCMKSEDVNNILAKGFMSVLAATSDLTGLTNITTTVLGVADYKCCECGVVARYKSDGTFDSYI
ncbi:hypothetical protein [Bacteroides ovatus]|jgi:predicted RNA-binding Zn-ribbon protein involved in translation (DUF1610 family)|uniref:hypothetical protein n=1 Tax=Bacteroides ovatus TaxID=28116 RepID=UPI001C029F59|nr:hypothetical protein [Bacteroides ovatus]MBT9933653.1 hypothetical protein [Bacteroides ovatus]